MEWRWPLGIFRGDEEGTERLIPFDTIPRSIPLSEGRVVERGCIQRVRRCSSMTSTMVSGLLKAGIDPRERALGIYILQVGQLGAVILSAYLEAA